MNGDSRPVIIEKTLTYNGKGDPAKVVSLAQKQEDSYTFTQARPFVVVGIPAFNEEKTIARIVLQAQEYADKVVVCDDGSMDWTAEIAGKLGADVLRHDKNCGYGAALQSLFRKAREIGVDVMVTLDGDGQHDPSEIPKLINPILEGKADIVIGSRFLGDMENSVPRTRRLGIRVITKLMGVASKQRISDAQSGFRAYGRKALDCLRLNDTGMSASVEALMKIKGQGLTVVDVPTRCNYKGLKTSTHNSLRHGAGIIMSILRLVVEERPLTFLGVPGIISLLSGVLFGAWMFQLYAAEKRIVTNVALASIAFILIGFFTIFTAITLYAITRLTQKMANQ